MGERAKLQGTRAGQFGLNDFLDQANNAATPQDMIRTILPVQEMREFQRRYFFDPGTQLLFLGERISLLRWIVPRGEYWRPLALFYGHTDSVVHNVSVTFSMVGPSAAGVVYIPVQTNIFGGASKVVYGANQDGSMTNSAFYNSLIHVTMEPGDRFGFLDETPAAGAATARWVFVYERVPQPATQRTPGVVGVVTVV